MFVVFRFFERYGFGVVCSDGRGVPHGQACLKKMRLGAVWVET